MFKKGGIVLFDLLSVTALIKIEKYAFLAKMLGC